MEIRALRPSDDRSAFQSGDEALDRFFRRYAGQNQFRHYLGVTYVAIARDRILGFVTVAATPRGSPRWVFSDCQAPKLGRRCRQCRWVAERARFRVAASTTKRLWWQNHRQMLLSPTCRDH